MAAPSHSSRGCPFSLSLLVLASMLLVVGTGAKPLSALAQELSGTITYGGSRVDVSDTQPISVYLAVLSPKPTLVDTAYVSTNGGTFVLHAPDPGSYYLLYSLDIHNYRDESMSVGAPFEVYKDCYQLSFPPEPAPCGDLITVPQTGVTLEFDDTAILSGIAGTAIYTGSHARDACTCAQAFRDISFSDIPFGGTYCCGQSNRYELLPLNAGELHYLRAFLDLNDNRQPDPGEPLGTCRHPAVAGPDQTDVAISFADDGTATCLVPSSPTPAQTPTATPLATPSPTPTPPTCVGDCDGRGGVTVDEIITLVNIALGTAGNSACPHGIPPGATVDVSLIIQAVNNALTGCASG